MPTVSLHVHERIDPKTIIQAVRSNGNGNGNGNGGKPAAGNGRGGAGKKLRQRSMFEEVGENPPLREAIDFYKHPHGWTNRLIAGDSLLVMNSLLEKEGLAGKVQMIYIDPPYGIRYPSNFQPFVNRRDVKDGKDEDLTQEPETIKAFRDTWELGIHSYLTYLRDRLLLAKLLLHPKGSCFVQIGDQNLHHVRELMDEVFGVAQFRCVVPFRTTTGKAASTLDVTTDFLVWHTRSDEFKYHVPYVPRSFADDENLRWVEWPDGRREALRSVEAIEDAVRQSAGVFRPNPLTLQSGSDTTIFEFAVGGVGYRPGKGGWKTNRKGMEQLEAANRLMAVGNTLCFIRYLDDFAFKPINNVWDDTRQSGFGDPKKYVVQTAVACSGGAL